MSCSFCNSQDHNIRGCDSPMVGILYERIKVIYMDIITRSQENIESRFKTILNCRFNLRELRAVCASCGCARTTSCLKLELLHVLYRYFNDNITLPLPEQEPEWLEVRRLPTEPDPIPEYARDLEEAGSPETVIQEEHDITWYIDRTPTPISDLRYLMLQNAPYHLRLGNIYDVPWGERDGLIVNLSTAFDAVATIPQIKKYDIELMLVSGELEEGVEECAICYENIECMDLVKLNCNHKFCGSCIKQSLNAHNNMYCGPSCALCRKEIDSFTVKTQEIYNLVADHCKV